MMVYTVSRRFELNVTDFTPTEGFYKLTTWLSSYKRVRAKDCQILVLN